ncbi:MAG: HAMP domain-containing sensor histidine kinase [Kiritimatiellae bacterium]|nr:HAMP domain-containing sensor histidine kinase [Kiritimatiellia bacterium]
MSSLNKGPDRVIPALPDLESCIFPEFEKLITNAGLCAGILAYKQSQHSQYTAMCSVAVPLAPFKGSSSDSLTAQLLDCHMHYPRPHVHSLKSSKFWKELSAVCDTSSWRKRALFIPFLVGDDALDFLLFSADDDSMKVTSDIINAWSELAAHVAAIMHADQTVRNLEVTEHYIKELGHDLASSVQAIISKVRNIRLGHVTGTLATTKLAEAEAEIMSIYRSSDTMGITVDPMYNIRDGSDFSIIDVVDTVIRLCESEAAERHITLEREVDLSKPVLWGDCKAIESALTQYVMNAIKYSRGSSKIDIRARCEAQGRIQVSVSNVGISITEKFAAKMWDFGERGREALELHVNGSGIGLFTVQKIVRAHGGTVGHLATGSKGQRNTFSFLIPRRDLLRKESCFR